MTSLSSTAVKSASMLSLASTTYVPTSVSNPPAASGPTISQIAMVSSVSRILYLSSTMTTLIACLTPMIAMMYLVVLSRAYHYARADPRPMNKSSGMWLQKYAPSLYILLVLSGLVEVAFSSWLILQYHFNHNYPSVETRTGVRMLLFSSSWTSFTAGAYSLLFIHPKWSKHPVSSIGAQAIWIFVTWVFWIAGAGLINTSVPSLLGKEECIGVVYCAQIRGLFGVAVIESLMLSAAMLAMLWLAWHSTRYKLEPVSFPMQ